MTLLKHLLGGLAKLIGTKATIAVSVVAVTVTTGAVGFAGYKVVGAIQERQQNSAFVQAQVEDEDSSIKDSGVTASKGTVTSDEQVQPIQSSANQQAEESTTGTTNSNSDNGEDEQANDNDQKDTASEKRAERLANVKGKKATATGQLSATQLTQQEILHLLAANSLNDIQASTHIQDPNASTSSSTNSSNHDNGTQNNTNSPTQNGAIQNPEPVPNGPNFINHSAQAVTPAVLYGTLSGVTSGSATVEIQPESKKKYTVMIYLCGTDLETNGHDGTNDILNMLASSYDMSQVNVLLCAGGTTKWHNTYMSGAGEDGCDNDQVRCNIYQLNPGAWPEDDVPKDTTFEWDDQNNRWENETAVNKVINANTLKLLGSYDAVNMGDGKLFAGFVDLCTENFPADNYGAILWNHGGGINGGICSSESTESVIGDSIETSELESALACTKLYSEQKQKLAFVGFDACLMGSTELAYNLSPYCDYMVGSSEISAGGWNYKSILNDISGKAVAVEGTNESIDNESIAKNMVELYYANHPGSADAIASIACYDTTKIQDAAEVINEASDAILQLYNNPDFQTDCYQMIKQARIHSFTTGGSGTTTIRVYNSDYVDIGNFFKQLSGYFGKYNEEYQKLENKNSEVADQLSQICSSIDSVLNQKYILNAGVQYDGNKVMYQDVANQNAAITGSYGTIKLMVLIICGQAVCLCHSLH